jgi:hypothetical protein
MAENEKKAREIVQWAMGQFPVTGFAGHMWTTAS